MKKIQKAIFACLLFLTVGCSSTTEEVEEVVTDRLANYTYDFINYVNLGLEGANGYGEISALTLKSVSQSDFDSEEDYVQVKQFLAGATVSASTTSKLTNGDTVEIKISSSYTISEEYASLLNIDTYTYTIEDLPDGILIDLKNDFNFTIYAFEDITSATAKEEINSSYSMRIIAVPDFNDTEELATSFLDTLRISATTDDNIYEVNESILSITYGFTVDSIIDNDIVLSSLSTETGVSACSTTIDKATSCTVSTDSVLKEISIANYPSFNTVDKNSLEETLLTFINDRFASMSKESLSIDTSALSFSAYENVEAIYKYTLTTDTSAYNEHQELDDYRYAVLVSATNENNELVYTLITMGLIQHEDRIVPFITTDKYLGLIMVEAGYSKSQATTVSEESGYELTLESVFY